MLSIAGVVDTSVGRLGMAVEKPRAIHVRWGESCGSNVGAVDRRLSLSTGVHTGRRVIGRSYGDHAQHPPPIHTVENPRGPDGKRARGRQAAGVPALIPTVHRPYDDLLLFLFLPMRT